MLQTTDNDALNTQATKNKRNQNILAGSGNTGGSSRVGKNIKNRSIVIKSAKSKKPKLIKIKKSDFVEANSSETDFFTSKAKKTFTHLQKAFTKIPIFQHFDLKYYIYIEIDALGYAIGGLLSQITLEQFLFNHVTYKDYSGFLKSEISQ